MRATCFDRKTHPFRHQNEINKVVELKKKGKGKMVETNEFETPIRSESNVIRKRKFSNRNANEDIENEGNVSSTKRKRAPLSKQVIDEGNLHS
jgi:hypothetical protein